MWEKIVKKEKKIIVRKTKIPPVSVYDYFLK